MTEAEVYPAIGERGFTQLVAAFYRRVAGDDLVGAMYPQDDLAAAEVRLRDFLIGRFGGPGRYMETRGHPRLRMRHLPFRVDAGAAERWLAMMTAALIEAMIPPDASAVLLNYFQQTAAFLVNHQPPSGGACLEPT